MAGDPKRRTQVERRDEAERRLLEAAILLIDEHGFDGITLGEVGVAAGYSRGLPAHYFGSKQSFQERLLEYISAEFRDKFLVKHAEPGLLALSQLIANSFDLAGRDPIYMHILQIMLSEPPGGLPVAQNMLKVRKDAFALYERHVREGIRSGTIRHNIDPTMVTRIVVSAICGALRIAVSNSSANPKSIGNEVVEFVLHGLSAPRRR
jgi:AcrR family transcriptional regulator